MSATLAQTRLFNAGLAAAALGLFVVVPVVAFAPEHTSPTFDASSRVAATPRTSEAYLARAEQRRASGELERALADLDAAALLPGGFAEAERARAKLYLETGRPTLAARSLERLIAAKPNDPEALLLLARANQEAARAGSLTPQQKAPAAERPNAPPPSTSLVTHRSDAADHAAGGPFARR